MKGKQEGFLANGKAFRTICEGIRRKQKFINKKSKKTLAFSERLGYNKTIKKTFSQRSREENQGKVFLREESVEMGISLEKGSKEELFMSEHFVISMSRQYGCGGRELAGILAEKLGVKLYDRQIVHIAAAKLGIDDLSEEELLEMEKQVQPISMNFMPFHSFGTHMGESSRGMFMSESAAIHRLADDSSCVILGRCADYVLREQKNHFALFVCADDDFREARGKTIYDGMTLKELDVEDKKRARYYNYYTGRDWGDGSNYDLVVNTSHASLEAIADGIISYIKLVRGFDFQA